MLYFRLKESLKVTTLPVCNKINYFRDNLQSFSYCVSFYVLSVNVAIVFDCLIAVLYWFFKRATDRITKGEQRALQLLTEKNSPLECPLCSSSYTYLTIRRKCLTLEKNTLGGEGMISWGYLVKITAYNKTKSDCKQSVWGRTSIYYCAWFIWQNKINTHCSICF